MSTTAARNHAKRAEQAASVEDKLNEIAKAIYALADALDHIKVKVGG